MEQIRIGALGGQDENGKNLYLIEINQNIFVVEAGFKYPETSQLGIEYIIPNYEYLFTNKQRVKGIFITHAHDDVMGGLEHLMKGLDVPIYTTPFTGKVIQEQFGKKLEKKVSIKLLKRNGDFQISGVNFKTFGLTHSVPDAFGLAFETKQGYIVFAGEYIVDFDVRLGSFVCDAINLAQIGKKGVLCLLSESSYADRLGNTAPKHRITSKVEPFFQDASGRIIVTLYQQNMFRLIEILDLSKKFRRNVVFLDEGLLRLVKIMESLGYFVMPKALECPISSFSNDLNEVVIIVSGSGTEVFKRMNQIAINEHELVELKENDTIIIASPIVPGTEIEAGQMENELYKSGAIVKTLNRKEVYSMHPSIEDLKMFNFLLKPKYYIPIVGEYRQLVQNANIALEMGYRANRIIVLDNGQMANFIDGELKDTASWLEVNDVMIDGNANLDSSGMVLRDREILSKDGVIIVGIALDFYNKEIIAGPDVQTRGVIYLKDAEHIIKELIRIIEDSITLMVQEDTYSNANCRLIIKEKISKYIIKETGKRPMVLPTIIEVRNNGA